MHSVIKWTPVPGTSCCAPRCDEFALHHHLNLGPAGGTPHYLAEGDHLQRDGRKQDDRKDVVALLPLLKGHEAVGIHDSAITYEPPREVTTAPI